MCSFIFSMEWIIPPANQLVMGSCKISQCFPTDSHSSDGWHTQFWLLIWGYITNPYLGIKKGWLFKSIKQASPAAWIAPIHPSYWQRIALWWRHQADFQSTSFSSSWSWNLLCNHLRNTCFQLFHFFLTGSKGSHPLFSRKKCKTWWALGPLSLLKVSW